MVPVSKLKSVSNTDQAVILWWIWNKFINSPLKLVHIHPIYMGHRGGIKGMKYATVSCIDHLIVLTENDNGFIPQGVFSDSRCLISNVKSYHFYYLRSGNDPSLLNFSVLVFIFSPNFISYILLSLFRSLHLRALNE